MIGRRGFLGQTLFAALTGLVAVRGGVSRGRPSGEEDLELVPVRRHDCSFIQLARHDFAEDIESGVAAGTERRVRCPLCGDRLVLSAGGSVARVSERL